MIEPLVVGEGAPVTFFAGGLGQTATDLRVFGSGVPGTRVFQPTIGTDAAALLTDLAQRCDSYAPSHAVGVSLGAGALLTLAGRRPSRFSRLVAALPPHPDHGETVRDEQSQQLIARLGDALRGRDQSDVTAALLAMQPEQVRDRITVRVWARRQADALTTMNLLPLLDGLATMPDLDALSLGEVDVPVLVLAQAGDPMHPVSAAERLAELLPSAELVVSDVPWVWSARDRLREVVTGFLAAEG